MTKEALEKGYKIELLKAAGLIHLKENGEAFDFLRGRVVFPIHSLSGKTIAFAGRVLKNNDKVAKYINSPETDIYSKSKTLYGLFFAKNSIRQIDECLLTEGYTDVISLHQAAKKAHHLSTAAFTDFSREHAKNIVIFKAEILMRDAGSDPVKRAEVIKDVIETIARIPRCDQAIGIHARVRVTDADSTKMY